MKISDLRERTPVDEIVLKITSKDEPRSVKGGVLTVCDLTGEDETGTVTVTLWNDDIDKVNEGDVIKITKGWCASFKDKLQVSSGKFGSIEVLESTE